MKIVEFIAPVEAIRGNMSGRQNLLYPTNDNKAYEGPVGSVNYARNYSPRFVGAKIAKSGKKYFTVRTKSANHLTAKSKKAMALLGGAGALYAALLKSSTLKAQAEAVWVKAQELGDTRTFRAFMMYYFRNALIAHSETITLTIAGSTVSIDNPWRKVNGTLNLPVSQGIRMKFWTELMNGGILFTIDGAVGMAQADDVFENVVGLNYNILGLTIKESTVRYNGLIVRDSEGAAVNPEDDTITANAEYTTVTA